MNGESIGFDPRRDRSPQLRDRHLQRVPIASCLSPGSSILRTAAVPRNGLDGIDEPIGILLTVPVHAKDPPCRKSAAAQRRHHRPRRSRQDHARRRAAAAERRVPRQPAGRRARDGQHRPRARARHHHPGQEHGRPLRRPPHQHRRHARPRRLRRRGGAHAVDGRRRDAAGRCVGRAAAADALRAAQGARARPAADRRHEQDRPRRTRARRKC